MYNKIRQYSYNQLSIYKVEVQQKLLISQSKFSGSRKFTLKYQKFEKTEVKITIKIGQMSIL